MILLIFLILDLFLIYLHLKLMAHQAVLKPIDRLIGGQNFPKFYVSSFIVSFSSYLLFSLWNLIKTDLYVYA